MADIETDLPTLKIGVAKKSDKKPAAKTAAKSEGKKDAKASKPVAKPAAKAEAKKPAKVEAKKPTPKKDAAKDAAKAPVKAKAPAAKANGKTAPAKAAAPKANGTAVTADAVASKIAKLVSGGKIEAVKVDYASGKSVVDGLAAKAATLINKAYSDKTITSFTHENAEVAKAVKAALGKGVATVRNELAAKQAKKLAGVIVKAAKAADAGKLTAADYRGVVLEVK